MSIDTVNPSTGELIHSYSEMSSDEVDTHIQKAKDVFGEWKNTPLPKRIALLDKVIAILNENQQTYAELITKEMGKPIAQAVAEVAKCRMLTEYYRDNIASFLEPKQIKTEMTKSMTVCKPIGTVFAIMPWNYPMWQVFRFLIPNVTAGNVALLSHAPISTGMALAIFDIFKQAGYPEGAFKALVIDIPEIARVIAHPDVAAVTLTGSERAGRAVASAAGAELKKVVLELGGADPYVILADADLDLAANAIVSSRLNNAGQVCISAKRIIVDKTVHSSLVNKVMEKVKSYLPGDPMDTNTKLGPMARGDLRAELHHQVQQSIEAGAELLCGGVMPEGKGFYYPATVLDNVKKGSVAYQEELFGPVISFIPFDTEEEAIDIANGTRFGLGSAVFTQDVEKGEDWAINKIEAGTCAVNDFVRSDPRLPLGGIKASGYGREMAEEGLHEFMNVKTVTVR